MHLKLEFGVRGLMDPFKSFGQMHTHKLHVSPNNPIIVGRMPEGGKNILRIPEDISPGNTPEERAKTHMRVSRNHFSIGAEESDRLVLTDTSSGGTVVEYPVNKGGSIKDPQGHITPKLNTKLMRTAMLGGHIRYPLKRGEKVPIVHGAIVKLPNGLAIKVNRI